MSITPKENLLRELVKIAMVLGLIAFSDGKEKDPMMINKHPLLETCTPMEEFNDFSIDKMKSSSTKVSLTEVPVMVIKYPSKIEVLLARLAETRHYCYEGGPGDSNTGCTSSTHIHKMEKEELKTWKDNEGKCKTGRICVTNGDCWGSWAQFCLPGAGDERQFWRKPSEVGMTVVPYSRFAYHTCSRSYNCANVIAKIPTYAMYDSSQKTHYTVFNTASGVTVRIQDGQHNLDVVEGTHYYYEKLTPEIKHSKASCFKTRSNVTTCTLLDSDDPLTLTLGEGCVGTVRNYVVVASCNELLNTNLKKNADNVDAAASIEDVKSVAHQLLFVSAQNEYNIATLNEDIKKVSNLIIDTITSLMRRDPFLLGALTNSPVKTFEVPNKSSFRMLHCPHPNMADSSRSCTNLFKKTNGIWIAKSPSEICDPPVNTTTSPLRILEESSLSFVDIGTIEFRGATSDNREIKKFRDDLQSKVDENFYSQTEGPSTNFNPLEVLRRIWESIVTCLGVIGGIYAVINILVIICNRYKR